MSPPRYQLKRPPYGKVQALDEPTYTYSEYLWYYGRVAGENVWKDRLSRPHKLAQSRKPQLRVHGMLPVTAAARARALRPALRARLAALVAGMSNGLIPAGTESTTSRQSSTPALIRPRSARFKLNLITKRARGEGSSSQTRPDEGTAIELARRQCQLCLGRPRKGNIWYCQWCWRRCCMQCINFQNWTCIECSGRYPEPDPEPDSDSVRYLFRRYDLLLLHILSHEVSRKMQPLHDTAVLPACLRVPWTWTSTRLN